jgi:hypothetical protein
MRKVIKYVRDKILFPDMTEDVSKQYRLVPTSAEKREKSNTSSR